MVGYIKGLHCQLAKKHFCNHLLKWYDFGRVIFMACFCDDLKVMLLFLFWYSRTYLYSLPSSFVKEVTHIRWLVGQPNIFLVTGRQFVYIYLSYRRQLMPFLHPEKCKALIKDQTVSNTPLISCLTKLKLSGGPRGINETHCPRLLLFQFARLARWAQRQTCVGAQSSLFINTWLKWLN